MAQKIAKVKLPRNGRCSVRKIFFFYASYYDYKGDGDYDVDVVDDGNNNVDGASCLLLHFVDCLAERRWVRDSGVKFVTKTEGNWSVVV